MSDIESALANIELNLSAVKDAIRRDIAAADPPPVADPDREIVIDGWMRRCRKAESERDKALVRVAELTRDLNAAVGRAGQCEAVRDAAIAQRNTAQDARAAALATIAEAERAFVTSPVPGEESLPARIRNLTIRAEKAECALRRIESLGNSDVAGLLDREAVAQRERDELRVQLAARDATIAEARARIQAIVDAQAARCIRGSMTDCATQDQALANAIHAGAAWLARQPAPAVTVDVDRTLQEAYETQSALARELEAARSALSEANQNLADARTEVSRLEVLRARCEATVAAGGHGVEFNAKHCEWCILLADLRAGKATS